MRKVRVAVILIISLFMMRVTAQAPALSYELLVSSVWGPEGEELGYTIEFNRDRTFSVYNPQGLSITTGGYTISGGLLTLKCLECNVYFTSFYNKRDGSVSYSLQNSGSSIYNTVKLASNNYVDFWQRDSSPPISSNVQLDGVEAMIVSSKTVTMPPNIRLKAHPSNSSDHYVFYENGESSQYITARQRVTIRAKYYNPEENRYWYYIDFMMSDYLGSGAQLSKDSSVRQIYFIKGWIFLNRMSGSEH